MRSSLGCCLVGLLAVMLCQTEQRGGMGDMSSPHPSRPDDPGLSTFGAQQKQLQNAHEENLEDTSRLVKLSQELKWELANNDRTVLSLATVKKMDEIERLIKRIRARVGRK
ncbi:MAG: hypothetical protein LAQ69_36710 [Acidobacteriia bacterium]|nr:hypothetical protein [Terriglobia bacterium]